MIGYYVHHQGGGHRQRMRSIAAHMVEPITVLSSIPPREASNWVHLPLDDTGPAFREPTAHGTMHWVPQHHEGLRQRMAMIAAWIDEADPSLVVVDVSVEVATLCRLLGVPTVLMAMRGDRSDRPHRNAYDGAHALIATWKPEFADPAWPKAWRAKTFHAGPISRFDHLPSVPPAPHDGRKRVLVLWGEGAAQDSTAQFTSQRLAAAAVATPDWTWRCAGGKGEHRVDSTKVWALLRWADVVITHAGQNAVAEVAASRTPAIVVADARPHGEQHNTARTLHASGVAIGLDHWPADDAWAGHLQAAVALGGAGWARWAGDDAAGRAAQFLTATATAVRLGTQTIASTA